MTTSDNNRRAARGLVFREIVGWFLVMGSLAIFWKCFQHLEEGGVIQGFIFSIVGVMLFRGGLQLVKVAVAARALRPAPIDAG